MGFHFCGEISELSLPNSLNPSISLLPFHIFLLYALRRLILPRISFRFWPEKPRFYLLDRFFLLGFCSSKPALVLPTATVSSQAELEDEAMFEKLLESEPENMEAMKAVLYKKMRRGKTEDAVKYVEKLVKLEPGEVEWKLLEALCYETMGQLSKGDRMVMHKTHDTSVFDMLKEAMEVARQGNRVTEERNIQVLIGQMHIVKGQFEEGLKVFQHMGNENPRDFRP